MFKQNNEYKSRFRLLKGGKVSLVVSAVLVSVSLSTPANAIGCITDPDRTIDSTETQCFLFDGALEDFTITDSGSIDVTDYTFALRSSELGATHTIDNSGSLLVNNTSDNSYTSGILIYAPSTFRGTIYNDGEIDVEVGYDSVGTGIYINHGVEGTITNTDIGTINVHSNDDYSSATGIFINNDESSTITNSGSITATSSSYQGDANGIATYTMDGTSIENAQGATLSATAYDNAIGITNQKDADNIDITNSGTITITSTGNGDATGINFYGARANSGPAYAVEDINNITISNSNVLTVNANTGRAYGIKIGTESYTYYVIDGYDKYDNPYGHNEWVESDITGVDISNSGSITVASVDDDAAGMKIFGGGSLYDSSIENSNQLTVSSTNADAIGIYIATEDGMYNTTITNTNTGVINVSGEDNVLGIEIDSEIVDNSNITNAGSIDVTATGNNTWGIAVLENLGTTSTVENTGTIEARSEDEATGIFVRNLYGTINNSGTITADAGDSTDDYYRFNSYGIYVDNAGEDSTITNSGTITAMIDGVADKRGYSIKSRDFDTDVTNTGNLYGNLNVDGTVENAGLISLPYNANGEDSAYSRYFAQTVDGTLEIGLMSDGEGMEFSQLYTRYAAFADGSTINITDAPGADDGQLLVGERMTDVVKATGEDGLTLEGDLNITDDFVLIDFETIEDENSINDNQTLDLMITEGQTIFDSTVAGGGDTPAQANAQLLEDFVDENEGMDEFVEELNECTTNECVAKAVDELEVKLAGAGVGAAKQTAQAIAKIVRQRQPGIGRGANSGEEMFTENNFWFKPFGTWGKQKDKNGLSGYDVDTYGFGVGIDGINKQDQQFGAAFFYTNADVDVNNVDQSADINGYTLMGYGSVPIIDDKTKFLYQLGYSWQNTDTSRDTLTGDATADYTSKVASVDLKMMRDYQVNDDWLLQPTVGVLYSHFSAPSYSESGAGVANLDVDSFSTSEFLFNLGTVANYRIDESSRFITTLDLSYDMQDKDDSVSSTTEGGLQLADADSIDNGRFGYAIGVGYEQDVTNNSNINFTYEYSGEGSKYSTNAVSMKYVLTF